jgi:hypothetical protein
VVFSLVSECGCDSVSADDRDGKKGDPINENAARRNVELSPGNKAGEHRCTPFVANDAMFEAPGRWRSASVSRIKMSHQ